MELAAQNAGIPGLPELATYRAELLMVQRRMVELLVARQGWRAGWASVKHKIREDDRAMDEVDLDDVQVDSKTAPEAEEPKTSRCLPAYLAQDLESEDAFHSAYERLSEQAMRYFALATQTKSVEAIIGDLAVLKRQQGDVASAETYIKHLPPSYEQEGWSVMQAEMLSFYAECLKELGQKLRYVETVLKLLGKVARRKMAQRLPQTRPSYATPTNDDFDVSGLLADAIAVSASLATEVTSPLEQFFSDLELDREVVHLEDKDGFSLRLRFRHVLDDDSIELEQVSLRLVGLEDPNQEIRLVSDGAISMKSGIVELRLATTTTAFGLFLAESVTIHAGKLSFVHHFRPQTQPTLKLNDDEVLVTTQPSDEIRSTQPVIFVYPVEHAFDTHVKVRKDVHIDKPRRLEVCLSSGWNEIRSINLRMKPTSAGLRLHLADATFDGVERDDQEGRKQGQLALCEMAANTSAMIEVPYTVDQATPRISMRLEIRYETSRGSFTFLKSVSLRHELPLDVDVDDIFRADMLFSRFTVRPTAGLPLVITDADLQDSSVYGVHAPPLGGPVTVYANSPLELMYKVTRKQDLEHKSAKRDAALCLTLQYMSTAEILAVTVQEAFAAALLESEYQRFSRLLLPVVAARCKALLAGSLLEVAVLLGQLKTPSFTDLGWQYIVAPLPQLVRSGLSEWLLTWHREHTSLPIDYDSALAKESSRRLKISVEIPTVDIVFTTSLTLRLDAEPRTPRANVLALGKPVRAELRVNSTDAWSAHLLFAQGKQKAPQTRPHFVLEVQADPEIWLLGGPRRVHFSAVPDDPVIFSVTLVPLKVGEHRLPVIDIQTEPQTVEEGRSGAPRDVVSCETHCVGSGQTIEVIRDVRITRIHIQDSAAVDVGLAGHSVGAEPG